MHTRRHYPRLHWTLLAGLCALAGCYHTAPSYAPTPPPDGAVPRELSKVVLPPYVIEPPDELLVQIYTPPDQHLGRDEKNFSYALTPVPVDGRHLVRMDGTINLGIYGSVQVAGLTLDQARERIRTFILEQSGRKPGTIQVSVDVLAYNSKVYYVITDGAGYGEQVYPFPVVGSETVLDAMGRINGLPQVASKRDIWVARRSPNGGPEQILPVCWEEITKEGITRTNYQVLPGDRIYVSSQWIIKSNNNLRKIIAPIEQMFGITLLGSETVNSIKGVQAGTTLR